MTEQDRPAPGDNPRFRALIEALSELSGLQAAPGGLQAQAGPYLLRVLPDGSHDDRLVIEVKLASASDAPAAALALLHRVNHVARFHHGWQISLDEDDGIVLHTQRLISRTDARTLEALMASGLERAAHVAGLWHKSLQAIDSGAPAPAFNWEPGALRA